MTKPDLSIILTTQREYLLLSKLAKLSLNKTLAETNTIINNYGKTKFLSKLKKLRSGYPLDYLVGEIQFSGNTFKINSSSLIPREETEYLIDELKNCLNNKKSNLFGGLLNRFASKQNLAKTNLVDIGCGCGVIGLSLSKYFKEVFMLDISKEVLDLAVDNSKHLAVDNCTFSFKTEAIRTYTQAVDNYWIVCNLPYVPNSEKTLIKENNIAFEPPEAIFGGEDGLDIYRFYLGELQESKNLPQIAIFELHKDNLQHAKALFMQSFPNNYSTYILKDQNGIDRFLVAVIA